MTKLTASVQPQDVYGPNIVLVTSTSLTALGPLRFQMFITNELQLRVAHK